VLEAIELLLSMNASTYRDFLTRALDLDRFDLVIDQAQDIGDEGSKDGAEILSNAVEKRSVARQDGSNKSGVRKKHCTYPVILQVFEFSPLSGSSSRLAIGKVTKYSSLGSPRYAFFTSRSKVFSASQNPFVFRRS